MHPIGGKGLSISRLALGDLILMVREDQVLPACMDIDLIAQILLRHDRTLDMPSGTPLAPGGLPVRLPLLLRLPEHEIIGVLLILLAGHLQLTEAGLELV